MEALDNDGSPVLQFQAVMKITIGLQVCFWNRGGKIVHVTRKTCTCTIPAPKVLCLKALYNPHTAHRHRGRVYDSAGRSGDPTLP